MFFNLKKKISFLVNVPSIQNEITNGKNCNSKKISNLRKDPQLEKKSKSKKL